MTTWDFAEVDHRAAKHDQIPAAEKQEAQAFQARAS
jgi:hypothetical protein